MSNYSSKLAHHGDRLNNDNVKVGIDENEPIVAAGFHLMLIKAEKFGTFHPAKVLVELITQCNLPCFYSVAYRLLILKVKYEISACINNIAEVS